MDDTVRAATAQPLLLREDRDGIARLTLNRPPQFNALSVELLGQLQSAIDSIGSDTSLRVVVIGGAGKVFCAGHDLREMRGEADIAFQRSLFRQCSRVMLALAGLPQPVIARVHGIATAAGCQLVAACDLAIAADDARFAVSGINLGLFCGTPSVALVRNLPRKKAFEMLMTGDFIDAPTALAHGLVNRIVPAVELDGAVDALARSIAAKSPAAVAAGKRLFYRQVEMGVEAAYQLASETMACNMMNEDALQRIDAFINRRTTR